MKPEIEQWVRRHGVLHKKNSPDGHNDDDTEDDEEEDDTIGIGEEEEEEEVSNEDDCILCKLERCACHKEPHHDSKSDLESPEILTKKKKKKKRISSICLENCKYEVVRKIAKLFGMRDVKEGEVWNVFWTDYSVSVEKAKEMKRFQPFLVDGFKFDMRVYALVTSVDPLRIFVYNDGLARFATSRYKEPAGHNTTNIYMHLTNYALNKHSRTYIVDEEAGSKRKLSTLNLHLERNNHDTRKMWAAIDDSIIKTVLAAHPVLKHSYRACFPCHDFMYACFELLGFDILLDYKLKPYILEVNHSPSFHTDARLDKEVKEGLLSDTFDILNLSQCHRKRTLEEDKQRVQNRLMQPLHNLPKNGPNETNASTIAQCNAEIMCHQYHEWELSHLGNYRLIYPNSDSHIYQEFFEQNRSSVFQETFASKAREEARRVQQEEFENKRTAELARRIGSKDKENKEKERIQGQPNSINPESPLLCPKKQIMKRRKKQKKLACSFEPTIIEESEEMERLAALTQRDYLVKSCGLMEQIYQMMKQSGNLRLTDMIKYGMAKKKREQEEQHMLQLEEDQKNKPFYKVLPKIESVGEDNTGNIAHPNSFTLKSKVLQPPWDTYVKAAMGNSINSANLSAMPMNNAVAPTLKWSSNMKPFSLCNKFVNESNFISKNSPDGLNHHEQGHHHHHVKQLPGLKVTCNEAAIFTRPNLPGPSEWPCMVGTKSTRTFIARHFSNTLKLQDLESRLSTDREMRMNAINTANDLKVNAQSQHQSTL